MPQQPALYSKLSVAQNLRLFARLEKLSDPEAARRADARGDRAGGPRGRRGGAALRAATSSASTSRSACSSEPPVLLLDEPSASLDPRQRERLWEFIARPRRARHGRRVLHPQRRRGRALRRPGCWSWSTASSCSAAPRPSSSGRSGETPGTWRRRSSASCTSAVTEPTAMRWLFVKDLQILRRSPLLVGLLIVYPIALALMIGFALSSPPGQAEGRVLQRGAAGPRQDQLRQPADQRLSATPASCSNRSSRSGCTLASRGDRQGPRRPGARGADRPVGHRLSDPEPGHDRASAARRSS